MDRDCAEKDLEVGLMTITIDLTPDVLERLHEKARREGVDSGAVAARLLAESLEWEIQDRLDAIEGVQRGLDDFAAGRYRPLEEVAAEKQVKHGL
jgi:predicted transcriptional regulator